VAVAAGLVPMAIGFDGGGSIRIPAALSGIFGLATTFGRVTFHQEGLGSMIKGGPLGATLADTALAYALLASPAVFTPPNMLLTHTHTHTHTTSHGYGGDGDGPPPAHVHGWEVGHLHPQTLADRLSGVRIGIFRAWFEDATAEVVAASDAAVTALVAQGATVVPIRIPNMLGLSLAHGLGISAEFSWAHDREYGGGWPLEPSTAIQLVIGRAVTGVEVHAANRMRSWAKHVVEELFTQYQLSAIITPTTSRTAPPLPHGAIRDGESNTAMVMQLVKHIFLANLIGLPAMSVPIGMGEGHLPIGLQLIGSWWAEATLLHLAGALEAHPTQSPLPRPRCFHSKLDRLLASSVTVLE